MTVAEGGGKRAVFRKFQDVYIPSLKANYVIWPAVQMLNFRVLPIQFQIVSLYWTRMFRCPLLTSLPAVRQHHRYRLDRIPLAHKLIRRSTNSEPEQLAFSLRLMLLSILSAGLCERGRMCSRMLVILDGVLDHLRMASGVFQARPSRFTADIFR